MHSLQSSGLDSLERLTDLLDSASNMVMDDDMLLLDLVAQQSQILHANDTIWEQYPHPLCMPLMFVPTTYPALTDTTPQDPYSIAAIRANARRYITSYHADIYVSFSDTNRMKQMVLDHLDVQRAIVKDIHEDQLDVERALK